MKAIIIFFDPKDRDSKFAANVIERNYRGKENIILIANTEEETARRADPEIFTNAIKIYRV